MILLKFFLLHYGILQIMGKYEGRKVLRKLTTKTKLFYLIAECEFCYNHFGGVLCLPLAFLFWGFGLELLAFPLMSTAFLFIIKKQVTE